MSTMTVIWTALPNGLTGNAANRRLRLSAYVSMRLSTDEGGDGALNDFPAALDWPALLQPGVFSIQVAGNNTAPVTADVISRAPDSALWRSIFAPSTRVASHQPDAFHGRPFNTYQAGNVHDQLRTGHQQLSTVSPVALPTRQQLQAALPQLRRAFAPEGMQPLPPIGRAEAPSVPDMLRIQNVAAHNLFLSGNGTNVHTNMALLASTARRLAAVVPVGAAVPVVPDDGSPEAMFKQLCGFHYREPVDPQNPPPALPVTDPATVLDFHQGLAALAQYPALLRLLGLVVDLEIPATSLPQSSLNIGGGRVTLIPVLRGSPALTSFTPATAYFLGGDFIFTSASNNVAEPESIAGLVNLALPGRFSVIQIDVDGLGLKSVNMAATNALSLVEDGDDAGGTPVPGAPGISILRTGHADVLAQRFATALANNQKLGSEPPEPVVLFAEDLTRGFRFDVSEGSSGWRSLHARTGNYVFPEHADGPLSLTILDEGNTQPAAAQRVDGNADAQAQLFVHNSLMLWKGWSLAAPRPGSAVGDAGPVKVTNQAIAGGLPLQVNFSAVPGSLPRLRFHNTYQVRARAVDLAGNSISLPEADHVLTNFLPELARPLPVLPANPNDLVFRRFEPVLAPHLVARERFTEGESLNRMVLRSNGDEPARDCAARLMSVVASSRPAAVIYTGSNERHIVPPKTSQITAEMHGMFDASFGTGVGFQSTYGFARKEKGRFTDTAILDTTTGEMVSIPDTDGIDPLTGGPITRAAVEFVVTREQGNPPNGYAVHHEPAVTLPFLPDPIAHGATLCGLPGMQQGSSAVLDEEGNLVTVPSPLPARTMGVIGSILQIDFGEKTSWPNYLAFRLQLAEPNPDHPVGDPTWNPQDRVLTVYLDQGEQATLRLSSYIDQNDLDVLGIWSWILARNAQAGMPPPDEGDAQTAIAGCNWMLTPFHNIKLVHAVQQPLLAPELLSLTTPRDDSATFAYIGATVPIHGKSTARLELAASWKEKVDDLSEFAPTTKSANAHVYDVTVHLPEDAADGPPLPVGTEPVGTYDVGADTVILNAPIGDAGGRTFLSRHEFGDTRHRTVTYQMTATTRFREYFPPEITVDGKNVTQVGSSVSIEVPSSARPAAPSVLYAIPMFEWSRVTNPDGGQVRTRIGGGIRVYLARPWYSSGDGEMLAVVFGMPDDSPVRAHESFLTARGDDPIFSTTASANRLQVGDFPLAVRFEEGLAIAEAGDLVVAIAAHEVAFDAARQLWYCDIRVDPGPAYSPLIRMALARYQPNSIRGAELSNIALADFVQLMPDRKVTVTPDPDDDLTIRIRVDGLTYQSTSWHGGDDRVDINNELQGFDVNPDIPLVEVSVEERIPGTIDEVGWSPSPGPGIRIVLASAVFSGESSPPDRPLWVGTVTVPEANRFRVVVRESEHFLNDDFGEHELSVFNPITNMTVKETHTFHRGAGRLVFAETIEM